MTTTRDGLVGAFLFLMMLGAAQCGCAKKAEVEDAAPDVAGEIVEDAAVGREIADGAMPDARSDQGPADQGPADQGPPDLGPPDQGTGPDQGTDVAADVSTPAPYPNEDLLVSGEWLAAHLEDPGLVVVDVRAPADYAAGHIPGAINTEWKDYVNWEPIKGVLKPAAEVADLLGKKGISSTAKVVVYAAPATSWGAEGRFFWMLEYLGHADVHVLNGGWTKWAADGRPTQAEVTELPATTFAAQVQEDRLAVKQHILDRLGDADFAIVDPRQDEEFNGWILYGEARGGHVPGAIAINYSWFFTPEATLLDADALKTLLEARGVTPNKEVTSYCTAGVRSGLVYFALRLMGYPKVSNYDGSMWEWSADPDCPMDKLANWQKLVHAGWVKALVEGGNPGTAETPSTYPGKGYVILDTRKGEEYAAGHIPGALNVGFVAFNAGPNPPLTYADANLLPADKLKTAIENLGITHETTVVVYGSAPPLFARVAWALMYAGVSDVRILNRGYAAWAAAGGTAETEPAAPTPAVFGAQVPGHPEYLATTESVKAALEDPGAVLADIRTWNEYIGIDPDHPYITNPGHIPGAVFLDWTQWMDPDGTLRSYTEVEALWKEKGVSSGKKTTFY